MKIKTARDSQLYPIAVFYSSHKISYVYSYKFHEGSTTECNYQL
ncbi:hypothetical protein SAMN05216540_10644 [Butyrivibrio sp. M55]|nr:hypothetical protein SAMN05216540_10644 [Butyrivibrio sp. M55]